VRTERDVLGNTRLDVVSREARAAGVRVGQTVAAARAKCATLHVRVVVESAVRVGLARVAEVALAFGPMTAFDVATDVVWVEIGGCAHLHGGEPALAEALEARVRALGHTCRIAIADGPRIAAAVARFARLEGARAAERGSAPLAALVVPEGKGNEAMRALPVEALGLEGEDVVWMRDLGLRTCGDLQKLPRRSLGARLGARTKDVMQLLGGEDRAPLDAWRPPEVPEERAELEWGASSVEALAFVAKALCDRLAARLEGRAVAAARVGLVLGLDRGLLGESAPPSLAIEVALPVPIVRAADLFAVVRARLERIDLPAPVLAVTLRALELSSSRPRALDLLAPEPRAERALTPLVAELTADLGGRQRGHARPRRHVVARRAHPFDALRCAGPGPRPRRGGGPRTCRLRSWHRRSNRRVSCTPRDHSAGRSIRSKGWRSSRGSTRSSGGVSGAPAATSAPRGMVWLSHGSR